ncbi:MAG: carboxypeptidase regulatory-like domain-containing protein, partial [Chloroflexi bacterium]|nr:carboxypeptidase regulatory-like domain-containing protein [Chloroflexota bacterium]
KDRLASPPAPTLSAAETYTWKISATAAPCTGTGDLSGIVRDVSGKIIVGATVSYANDAGARTSAKTNNSGQYLFNWGKEPALYHVSILAADGKTPTSAVVDIGFLGGTNPNCHVVLDWQKLQ